MKSRKELERCLADHSITAEDAENLMPLWTRRAVMSRARFHPDLAIHAAVAVATIFKLGKICSEQLVEVARFAAASQDAALASSILDELDYRVRVGKVPNETQMKQIYRHIAAIVTDAEQIQPLLQKIIINKNGNGNGKR